MDHAIETQLGIKNVKILKTNLLDSNEGKLFLKFGDDDLVTGELESLKSIQETKTIKCPKPYGIVKRNGSCALVTSYIDFHHGKDWAKAGNQLARMHLKNSQILNERERRSRFLSSNSEVSEDQENSDVEEEEGEHFGTEKFGFHVPTCCGRLPQQNEWTENWAEFFVRHRLKPQIDRLIENQNDRQLLDVVSSLYCKTEKMLNCRGNIRPALVHGDLWGGNWSMTSIKSSDSEDDVVPIVFDPSSSYSDPEFEFGIMQMFGGWTREFEQEYDKVIEKSKGRDERISLYELYHNLNHWNHFGGSYKNSSMSLIRSII